MDRTACTEPQCLYNGALYLYLYLFMAIHEVTGDRVSTVFKVLYYKSEGRWFEPSLFQWVFH